jgi:hypothetical protein
METLLVPPPLRERLGAAGSDGVVMMFAEAYRIGTDQLDRRLAESSASSERKLAEVSASFERCLAAETAKVRLEMATLKFDLLRWNFLFWIGQLAALTAILSAMLNSVR